MIVCKDKEFFSVPPDYYAGTQAFLLVFPFLAVPVGKAEKLKGKIAEGVCRPGLFFGYVNLNNGRKNLLRNGAEDILHSL